MKDPSFLPKKKRKANEIGTLMHTVMQHLPFREQRLTKDELFQYIDRLIDKQLIDEDAKEDIRIDEIMHFIDGPLYMEIAQADNVYTELPFVVNQIKVDGLTSEDEDVSIIQGMIDLIYESDGQFYFVDYKTDAFNRRKGMSDEEIGISSKKNIRYK